MRYERYGITVIRTQGSLVDQRVETGVSGERWVTSLTRVRRVSSCRED
jgi:hypothetical protein